MFIVHFNFIHVIFYMHTHQGFFVIRQEDVSISYLPLAHMFERMIQVTLPIDSQELILTFIVVIIITVSAYETIFIYHFTNLI